MEQAPKPMEPAKPKSKTMWYAVIVIVVIIVAAAAYYFFAMPSGTTYAVSILDDNACALNAAACKYDPLSINVPASKTVTWTNKGNAPHTIHSCTVSNNPSATACPTMSSGAAANLNFASSTLNGGQTFSQQFTTAGTYYYYCNIHLWMHGTVAVS